MDRMKDEYESEVEDTHATETWPETCSTSVGPLPQPEYEHNPYAGWPVPAAWSDTIREGHLGCKDPRFGVDFIQSLNLIDHKLLAGDPLRFMLAVIRNMQARDPVDAMVLARMACNQMFFSRAAERWTNCADPDEREAAARDLDRFNRSFAKLVELFDGRRKKGEQKITVNHQHHHVNVSEGSQAIVANRVNVARRTRGKKKQR